MNLAQQTWGEPWLKEQLRGERLPVDKEHAGLSVKRGVTVWGLAGVLAWQSGGLKRVDSHGDSLVNSSYFHEADLCLAI